MSLDAMNAVWKHSEAKGNALLALLAIADNADDELYEAYPSYDHLALKTRMGKRTVQDAVAKLLTTDELTLVRRGSQGRTNLYRVEADALRSKPSQVAKAATSPDGNRDGNRGGNLSATEPSVVEPSVVEPSVSQQLFETGPMVQPPPPESTATEPESTPDYMAEVWSHYLELFGEKLRIKELTDRRRKMIERAFKAAGGTPEKPAESVQILKDAISGLKAYRKSGQSSSTNTDLSVIFETGPHSQSNLTDQIEWWARQSESIGTGEASMPSITRAKITSRKVEVVQMLKMPNNEGAQARGAEALAWLKENHNLTYRLVDPDNPLTSRVEWIVEA